MSIADDVILGQVEYTFDPAGNAVLAVTRERYHNAVASQTGSLNDPSTAPKARVTYVAFFHDPLGRVIATADYGTNGGTALTRPATTPARSDNVLVTTFTYDTSGNLTTITDPAGRVTDIQYDALGREIERILNYVGSLSSSSSSSSSSSGDCDASNDRNLSISRTYTPDGNLATLTVVNAKTGDQTTTFIYGTTLADSDIVTSNLKRAEAFADSVGGSDQIQFGYNRRGEVKQSTDQNGTIHVLERDKMGRVIHDRVTVLGTGVDGTVRRISTTYDVLGRKSKVTSWNNASVSSGSIINEVQFVYDNFGRLITDYQSHGGAVITSTTPKVQYGFADGSANTVRPTSITCPNGRVLTFDYSTSGSMPDACSRVDSIKDSSQTLVQYSYLGLRKFVTADYPLPSVKWTLADLSGSNDPDTGDIYSGLDRFGRVKDNRWYNYGTSTDVDRIKHGYDRIGNRLYRQNTVATASGATFDELYTYDGVNRMHEMERGTLNGTQSAILSPVFTECWTQDSTANWSGYRQGTTPGSWSLVQQRSVNKVNEIVSFANSVGAGWTTPAYDPAGNMTTFPKANDPTTAQAAVYDAWYRLVKVSEGANAVAAYQYDGVNRRTIQQSYTSGTLTETRHCYYTTPSRWQVIEERVGTATVPERQFVWGLRYVDDLVLRDRDTTGGGKLNERLYALLDANWNITAIVNSSGSVQERYAYSPYGVPVFLTSTFGSRSSSSFDWRYLFTGRRQDTETGLYDFRYRVLSPLVGLFLSRDPLGTPDGPSLYAAWFVPNSIDPYGLQIPTSGQCWLGLGNKTICIGDIIPTGSITLDFNLEDESILSYIFNVPVNTHSVKSLQEAKNALDKYVSDKAHDAAKCGKPVCVPSITIAGHGSNVGYIQFTTTETISGSDIAYYLAFINEQPVPEQFRLSNDISNGPDIPIGPGSVVTQPPSNLRQLQILGEMIGKVCDNGRITILMCSAGSDTLNQQLRRLVTQLGKPNIDIVTYKGDCGYSWGGPTAK
jgi:RHS repeat-associated protein